MSRPVQHIDYFLSHDWHTPPARKYVALLVFFNLKAAGIAASLTCILILVLDVAFGSRHWIFESDPRIIGGVNFTELFGPYQAVVPIVYMIVLIWWQDMHRLFRTGTASSMFLDKVCIQQTDAELKQAGIRSLAGILKSSDKMVVLYSDEYFNRLWCVYELASWLHLKPDALRNVTFVPVGVSQSIHGWAVGSLAFYAVVFTVDALTDGFLMFAIALGASVVIAWTLRLCGNSMQQMLTLSERLGAFQVRNSQCYCCSVNHVDPDTRAGVPCDRQMVYEALRRWAKDSDNFLEEFDARVRDMAPIVMRGLERNLSSYRMALATMVAPAAPHMLRSLPFYLKTTSTESALRMTLYNLVHLLALSPLALRLGLHSAIWICPKYKRLAYPSRWFFTLTFFVSTAFVNSKLLEHESLAPQLVWALGVGLATLAYYNLPLVAPREARTPAPAPTTDAAEAPEGGADVTPASTIAASEPDEVRWWNSEDWSWIGEI